MKTRYDTNKWNRSKKGKAYMKTDKWKAYKKAYQKTDKSKAYKKAYQKTDKYKAYKKAYQKAYYLRKKGEKKC